ncbi:MAG: AAA family ATPase [Candidatus Neptunochlamydia sp.]|nr:AAA family ATPase [Candidatus Neptunochlamydia sp.]
MRRSSKKGEYIYVDKTGFAKKLIGKGALHHFISFPRRFGEISFPQYIRGNF